MQTPKTESGDITERIMAEIATRLPQLEVAQYNAIYESCLRVLSNADFGQMQRVKDISTALRDAISTYGDKPEILVTVERREAWEKALQRSGV